MTQEDKELLLKDLCPRLPYEVQCHIKHIYHLSNWVDEGDVILTGFRQNEFTKETEPLFRNPNGRNLKIVFPFDSIKPYLRPMSSMTQEEIDEYDAELDKDMNIVMNGALDKDRHITSDGKHFSKNFVAHFGNDWLNSHHFDFRGLIEKGLAIEAPEDMYKTE